MFACLTIIPRNETTPLNGKVGLNGTVTNADFDSSGDPKERVDFGNWPAESVLDRLDSYLLKVAPSLREFWTLWPGQDESRPGTASHVTMTQLAQR